MDRELIARAIAKQRGQPYGVDLGAPELTAPVAEPIAPPAVDLGQPDMPPAETAPEQQPAAPPAPPDAFAPAQGAGMDDALRSLDELTTMQANAAIREGDAAAEAGKRKGEAANEYAGEARAMAEQFESKDKAADAMFQRTMGEIRALNAAAAALPPPHDRRTHKQRVWGAIATVLGGGAAQDVINKGIDRDIAAQQAALDQKRVAAADKLTELGIARQYLGDVRGSAEFARGLRKERFAAEVEAAAGTLESKTARDKALQAAAQYKVDGKKEQLDALKKLMGGKMGAMEAAMLVKLGVLSPAEARAQMGTSQAPAQPTPGSKLDKAEQEGGKIDRARTDAIYDKVIKIAPALEANDRIAKYASVDYVLPTDATDVKTRLWNKAAGVVGVDTESLAFKEFMGDIEASRSAFMRLVSGAGVSEQEGARQWSEFGLDPGRLQSPAQLKQGIGRLRDRTAYYRSVIRASDPEAFDEMEHRIGGGETRAVGRTKVAPPTPLPDLSDRFRKPKK